MLLAEKMEGKTVEREKRQCGVGVKNRGFERGDKITFNDRKRTKRGRIRSWKRER